MITSSDACRCRYTGQVMAEARYVFPSSVEGIIKGLGPLATPALKAHLRQHGLDVDKVPPAIPVESWSPQLERIAVFTWPRESAEEAMRLLGLSFIRGWRKTALGAAASAVLRLVGPSRTLTRLDRAFRTSDNFTKANTELIGLNEALVSINEVHGYPSFWVGVLEGGLELLGRDGSVVVDEVSLPTARLRVKWV
jgi:uncharacterized protein (TIGR02265 family)